MKSKILIFFLLLFSLASSAQFVPQSIGGAPGVKSIVRGVISGDSGLIINSFSDTSIANRGPNIRKEQNLVIRVGDSLYYRNVTINRWVKFSNASASNNVYRIFLSPDSAQYHLYENYVLVDSFPTLRGQVYRYNVQLNSDSTQYYVYENGIVIDSASTLYKRLYTDTCIVVSDTTINGFSSVYLSLNPYCRGGGGGVSGIQSLGTSTDLDKPNDSTYNLKTVNSNVGTFGSASKTVTTTVNGKGLTTAISEQNIAIAESQVTNLVSDLAAKVNISDTAAMLLPYRNQINTNTANIATNIANILLKLNISDTAAMLVPYKTSYPRQAISVTGTGISYNSSTGVITGSGSVVTPSALTKTDDTNVTITLGGTPSTALLQATSLTLGWTGTLADARISSAATWNAKQNAITTSEQVATATASQIAFTFSSVPASYNDYIVFINGMAAKSTTDYTTSGNVVTLVIARDLNDTVIIRRTK